MIPHDKKNDPLSRIRHSAAHVLAQAVVSLYPGTKVAIGPVTAEGFYYDFDSPHKFQEEDFPAIEAKMEEIIKQGQTFKQYTVSKEDARKRFEKDGEVYKLEILEGLTDGDITFVENGPFVDLCEGGHIQSTKEIKAVKLLSVAGAYWRGSEKNPMLQRLYGTAFGSKEELTAFVTQREEALKRDHRKLGKELDLYSFHVEAPGMPFFHPKGQTVYDELCKYWMEKHKEYGYVFAKTPVLFKDDLWHRSGHYDHYRDNMYFSEVDEQQFAVKPMNCPGHTLVYSSDHRSYRDLPIRMAELGLVHRRELKGVLHGLFRVNAFTIDDAHIFCTEDQIESEITQVIKLVAEIYGTFGFADTQIYLSTRPLKVGDSLGSDELWDKATNALKSALQKNNMKYDVDEGGGAFYGPKIDFKVKDSIGRVWQCGTIQLDFQMPERFGLEYAGSDNKPLRPVMVHRAVFGSVERFYGILVEHYAGAFPLWLAPVQVRIATITDKQQDYAEKVKQQLNAAGIRVECDFRNEKIGFKIREAEVQKTPYTCVIGDKEMQASQVAVRQRGRKDLGGMTVDQLIQLLRQSIDRRADKE